MKRVLAATAAIALAAASTPSAFAEDLAPPMKVGQCLRTTVAQIGSRLENMPTSGSSIAFANGISQVSYDMIAAITASRAGDPVKVCLKSVPTGCPKGDDRGKIYTTTNLRTKKSWTLPDSQHSCGGA